MSLKPVSLDRLEESVLAACENARNGLVSVLLLKLPGFEEGHVFCFAVFWDTKEVDEPGVGMTPIDVSSKFLTFESLPFDEFPENRKHELLEIIQECGVIYVHSSMLPNVSDHAGQNTMLQ